MVKHVNGEFLNCLWRPEREREIKKCQPKQKCVVLRIVEIEDDRQKGLLHTFPFDIFRFARSIYIFMHQFCHRNGRVNFTQTRRIYVDDCLRFFCFVLLLLHLYADCRF